MISNDLLKGTLRTIVLKLLAEHPRMYGYEITQMVEEMSKGKIKLTFGALYPVLHKLEAEGHLRTETVNIGKRVRIYYMLTDEGISWSKNKLDEFAEFVETMSYILNPYPSKVCMS
jgi:PadR family transcriptional regulator, regulatory protein PadR